MCGQAPLGVRVGGDAAVQQDEGVAESPEEDWRVAEVLGSRGIPNRVDSWGEEYPHDWVTWREMLPKYVGELLGGPATSEEE